MPPPRDNQTRKALDRSMIHSVAWTGGAKLTAQVLSWLATLVVARLLSPGDYGLIGMAGVLIGVIQLLSEFGIGQTVITVRELSEEGIAQLNGLALLLGSSASAASMLTALPVARFFNSDRLVPVVIALSLGFALTAFKIVPSSLLRRDLEFGRLAVIEAVASAVLSITTVVCAALGLGVWALVWGTLISQAFSSAAVLQCRRVAFKLPTRSELTDSMTFTRHQLTGNLLWYTYSSSDFLVAGKVLGEKLLGLYYLAWSLSKAVPDRITGLIISVAPSYFSAVQSDVFELRRYLLRLTEAVALVAFPALAGVALLAGRIEVDLLGSRWIGLARPLRILAIYSALTSITPLLARVLTARRHTRFLVWTAALMTGTLLAGFWLGSHWGVTGIAVAWLLIEPPFQLAILRRTCRAIELPIRSYAQALWPAASMTAMMTLVVWGFLGFVRGQPGILRTATAVVVGVLAYLAVGLILHRTRLLGLFRAVRGR